LVVPWIRGRNFELELNYITGAHVILFFVLVFAKLCTKFLAAAAKPVLVPVLISSGRQPSNI
jgi:hypothetical protein